MSWKDNMKEAQGDSAKQAPKLHVDHYLQLKNIDNKPSFVMFVDGERKATSKPIEGAIVGIFLRMSAFDDNLGSKGGTYRSTLYNRKADNIAIFDINGRKTFGGTAEEGEKWLAENSTEGRAKKDQVLLITNDNGVYSVENNLTLGIDSLNLSKAYRYDHTIKFVPTLYSPDDTEISERAKQYLGKFAKNNPPTFVKFYKGKEITDDMAEKWGLEDKLETVKAMKEYMADTPETSNEEEAHDPVISNAGVKAPPMPGNTTPKEPPMPDESQYEEPPEENQVPPEDDLPF